MPQVAESMSSLLEELNHRLRDLEQRVSVLENRPVISATAAARSKATSSLAQPAKAEPLWPGFSSGLFPALGKAALGFAGAFLLRAITESTSVPRLPILAVAILYAFMWMLWAIQPDWLPGGRQAKTDRVAATTYALTSALILSPLLWEATIRFQVLSPAISATVLAAFVTMTLALCAGRDLQLIPWVATLASAITCLALIIATRDLVPLTTALLAVSLATEVTVIFGHQLTFRSLPAIVSDFAVWLVISVLASDSLPEGYRPATESTIVLLMVALTAIYAASVAIRTFVRLNRIAVFDIVQLAISLVLSTYGILRVTRGSAAPELGAVLLLLAFACYWGTLSRFAGVLHTRNRRITAYAAAVLLLGGSLLMLPAEWEVPFLCFCGAATTFLYVQSLKLSLGLHPSFFIAAALAISPLPTYIADAVAGSVPNAPRWPELTIGLTAALCYALGSHSQSHESRRRMLWVVPSFVALVSLAAVLISTVVRLSATSAGLAASHLSVIRTIVVCLLALGLGFASREPRIELGWIAYAAIALGALKLLFEDLRFGNPTSLVISFLSYGVVLILLPRVIRRNRAAG